jgi:hypothetical protein
MNQRYLLKDTFWMAEGIFNLSSTFTSKLNSRTKQDDDDDTLLYYFERVMVPPLSAFSL